MHAGDMHMHIHILGWFQLLKLASVDVLSLYNCTVLEKLLQR